MIALRLMSCLSSLRKLHRVMKERNYCLLVLFDGGIECIVNFLNGYQLGTLKKLMRLYA